MPSVSVVICMGSFVTPDHYVPFIETLKSRDFEVVCPLIPTNDVLQLPVADPTDPAFDIEPPSNGWPNGHDDAKVVRVEVEKLLALGKDVLLVAHSYGGWVASEVAAPELQKRNHKGDHANGIIGIFFAVANIIPKGQSLATFFMPKEGGPPPQMPPYVSFHKQGVAGLVTPILGDEFFFNDLAPSQGKHYAAIMRASPVQITRSSHTPYLDIPCAFLKCEDDKIMPTAVQEIMIGVSSEQGGALKVYNCKSGHFPMLSRKEELADMVRDFLEKNEAV